MRRSSSNSNSHSRRSLRCSPRQLKWAACLALLTTAFATLPTLSSASSAEGAQRDPADVAWLLSNAFLILTMQAGFGMLEAGLVSSRGTANILMKNLSDLGFGAIAWYATGYALANGGNSNAFMGASNFFLSDLEDPAGWLFGLAFAATASTIISGAVAGRMRFLVYCGMSALVTGVVYPLAAHWVWSDKGFLGELGFHDFAGCGPIHMVGGAMGITLSWFLKPRLGVFDEDGTYFPTRSSTTHTLFGTFILWWGWFAFNAGSSMSLSNGNDLIAAKAGVNTAIASGAGTVTTVFLSFFSSGQRHVDVFDTTAGVLASLVSITASCSVVTTGYAGLTGIIAAILAYYSPRVMVWLKIDDPVGVFPVHLVCGMWGLISVGLFANSSTISDKGLVAGGTHLLGVQMLGVLVFLSWGIITAMLIAFTFKTFAELRVSEEHEIIGLDEAEHAIVGFTKDVSHGVLTGEHRRQSFVKTKEEQLFFTQQEFQKMTGRAGDHYKKKKNSKSGKTHPEASESRVRQPGFLDAFESDESVSPEAKRSNARARRRSMARRKSKGTNEDQGDEPSPRRGSEGVAPEPSQTPAQDMQDAPVSPQSDAKRRSASAWINEDAAGGAGGAPSTSDRSGGGGMEPRRSFLVAKTIQKDAGSTNGGGVQAPPGTILHSSSLIPDSPVNSSEK